MAELNPGAVAGGPFSRDVQMQAFLQLQEHWQGVLYGPPNLSQEHTCMHTGAAPPTSTTLGVGLKATILPASHQTPRKLHFCNPLLHSWCLTGGGQRALPLLPAGPDALHLGGQPTVVLPPMLLRRGAAGGRGGGSSLMLSSRSSAAPFQPGSACCKHRALRIILHTVWPRIFYLAGLESGVKARL